jgi:hypothetical protein
MSRSPLNRRSARSALGALLTCCAALVLVTGCSTAESGMMAVTVGSDGSPVGLAVGCRYELRTGYLQRWVTSPEAGSTVTPASSPVPGYVEDGEIASWSLPAATEQLVAWTLDARDTVNDVKPLSGPPALRPGDAYRLVGTSPSGTAHLVQFTLAQLRHLQPGQAIIRDRGGEPRTIDLNQLVGIACTDVGLPATRSPAPETVSTEDG